jgi:hypothetical protein
VLPPLLDALLLVVLPPLLEALPLLLVVLPPLPAEEADELSASP